MFAVNLSGAEFGGTGGQYGWNYVYPSAANVKYYADKGVDTIRLPFRWERLQKSLDGDLDTVELGRIKAVLDAAQANGVKVVLDVHNFGKYHDDLIGTADVSISNFSNLWSKIAAAVKDHPAVGGYGLMNEPVGFADDNTWPNAAQAAIDAIRAIDGATAIYVSGQDWGSALNWIRDNDGLKNLADPAKNLVFEAHQYFDRWSSGIYEGTYDSEGAYATIGVDRLQPFIKWLTDNNLKGFIGEYAVPDNDPRWLTVMDNFVAEATKHNIMTAYWGGGPWWGDYPMSLEPENGVMSAQMVILQKHIDAYRAAQAEPDPETPPVETPPVPLINEVTGTAKKETLTGVTDKVNVLHGMNGTDTLKGANLEDILSGGNDNDVLYGYDADDLLDGGHGNDILYGADGEDYLTGGDGHDYLSGGNGHDVMDGGNHNDTLYGLNGNDTLSGNAGNDKILGGNDNDTIDGGAGNDSLYGENGDDTLHGGDGLDYLHGGLGNDTLNGNAHNDVLYGFHGDDVLNGGDGIDKLFGGYHNDLLYGDGGNDYLYGEFGDDTLNGGTGNDYLHAGAGNDVLGGGDGNDILYGVDGYDTLDGGDGLDKLFGGNHNDVLNGGTGNDYLYGEYGNDVLHFGAGSDILYGGAGADTFMIDANADMTGMTTVMDFNKKNLDKIDLSELLSGYDPLTHAIEDFVRFTTVGKNTVVGVDVDGGGDAFVNVLTLRGVTGMTNEQALVDSGHLVV